MGLKPRKHCSVTSMEHQICMPISNGKVICVDYCIHHIVAALNAANVRTVACCCGHGKSGHIILEDGRVLDIFPTLKNWKKNRSAIR